MDLYAELGVSPQAEPDVIRAAYRALAQRYHPDKPTGAGLAAAAKMTRINRAYEVLGQAASRQSYDREQALPPQRLARPLIHRTTSQHPMARPFLTTYDQRGRLHTYV